MVSDGGIAGLGPSGQWCVLGDGFILPRTGKCVRGEGGTLGCEIECTDLWGCFVKIDFNKIEFQIRIHHLTTVEMSINNNICV